MWGRVSDPTAERSSAQLMLVLTCGADTPVFDVDFALDFALDCREVMDHHSRQHHRERRALKRCVKR